MDINLINRKLKDIYGSDLLGQAIFRVVWSDDLLEKRFDTFTDMLAGTNILIRKVKEVREVKKYNYLEPQYILEKLTVNHDGVVLDSRTLNPSASAYICVWAFGHDKNGKIHNPVWRGIVLLLKWVLHPEKKTPSDVKEAEFKEMQNDEKVMFNMLEATGRSSMGSAMKDGDAVTVAKNYPKESPLLRGK